VGLNIQSGTDRADKNGGIKTVVLGKSGVGKTTLLKTLAPDSTLFIDLEAGDLAVQDWGGDRLDVFAEAQRLGAPVWELARGIACWLGGPSPLALAEDAPYTSKHFNEMRGVLGDPAPVLEKYQHFFIDSITLSSRACFAWAKAQPRAFSQKTGKPDLLGAYGLLKEEMIAWLTQWQHVRGKDVTLVGILDDVKDDFNRQTWVPQIEGSGTANALPGIVDQVITMAELKAEDGTPYRAFVCHTMNPWGYPAKDRSTCLDMVEEPNLGKLLAKIRANGRKSNLTYQMPAGTAALPQAAEATT
jgi:hypothetical protein